MKTDAKELIQKAFEMARNSGKPDWHRMTLAVLKNRILVLTKGEFKESEYGTNNMHEFVALANELVNVDKSFVPAVIEIKGEFANQPTVAQATNYDRIRPDLWQAVMDYTSGNKYVWDVAQSLARPQGRDDSSELVLPTISAKEDMKWRQEFAKTAEGELDEFAKGRLAAFVAHSVSPKVLPQGLQWKWNDFVKAKIIKTLADWFEHRKLAPPDRLTVSVRRAARPTSDAAAEELRDLIVNAVKAMTPAELLTVSLPPSAVLRVRKDRT